MTRRHSIQPYLLLLVFGGPLVVAAIAYYGPWDWARPGGAPHGELLQPPVEAPAVSLTTPAGNVTPADWLERRWSLIYATDVACEEDCIGHLNRLNQVRLALGKDLGRAQVVLLFVGAAPAMPSGADVTVARFDDERAQPLRVLLGELGLDRVYVADPLGRLVMHYAPDMSQAGLLEDLERLMAISPIG
jgi:hypothetical protein